MAVAELIENVVLHTFHPVHDAGDVAAAFAPLDITTIVHPSPSVLGFEYLHPLSRPRISPVPILQAGTAEVKGDLVLRFGCLEGDFRVNAHTAIYDPQSGTSPGEFGANGSRAERLALVLNRGELSALAKSDELKDGMLSVREASGASVVVVKAGVEGAFVLDSGLEPLRVPAYEAETVYKIGSGDVFSATFAFHWGSEGRGAAEAADLASRRTAAYVETRLLPCPAEISPRCAVPEVGPRGRRVYLAGPFFSAGQIWLVEEARAALLDLGLRVFSPLHDVGLGSPEAVAPADLRGMECCDVVLALLPDMDPGTLFECGHAHAIGKPVIAYVVNARSQDPTMLIGTGAVLESDFATALHRAAWLQAD